MIQQAASDAEAITVIIRALISGVQVVAGILLAILTFYAKQIHSDVRDMRDKVTILWNEYERSGVVPGVGQYRGGSHSPNVTERL